jgi:hypothetical protein
MHLTTCTRKRGRQARHAQRTGLRPMTRPCLIIALLLAWSAPAAAEDGALDWPDSRLAPVTLAAGDGGVPTAASVQRGDPATDKSEPVVRGVSFQLQDEHPEYADGSPPRRRSRPRAASGTEAGQALPDDCRSRAEVVQKEDEKQPPQAHGLPSVGKSPRNRRCRAGGNPGLTRRRGDTATRWRRDTATRWRRDTATRWRRGPATRGSLRFRSDTAGSAPRTALLTLCRLPQRSYNSLPRATPRLA